MKTKISLCTNTYKETFRDSNYDTVWANSESLSSKDYRSTYGRSQGKKPDPTIYRIIEKGEFTRTSKVGGYNLYKVAIFCQDGINNILLCENEPGVQTFGGHICEGYIYFCMMDLEYDGIYRFFQLSEIKIAQKLSEFNLMRKLILEAYFFK
ncbi:1559_t:CDS:2, partial [Rhizophagus irregularis]